MKKRASWQRSARGEDIVPKRKYAFLRHERRRVRSISKGKNAVQASPKSPKRRGASSLSGPTHEPKQTFHGVFVSVLTCIVAGPTPPPSYPDPREPQYPIESRLVRTKIIASPEVEGLKPLPVTSPHPRQANGDSVMFKTYALMRHFSPFKRFRESLPLPTTT